MSTRRARIKAVAALPPRRKNQESADNKPKVKEGFEENVKGNRTPRKQTPKAKDKSPSKSTTWKGDSPTLEPLCPEPKTPIPASLVKIDSPKVVEKTVSTPKSEVSVITATPSWKNAFAPPRIMSSPDRKRIASLLSPPPKQSTSAEIPQKPTIPISNVQDKSEATNVPKTETTIVQAEGKAENVKKKSGGTIVQKATNVNEKSKPTNVQENNEAISIQEKKSKKHKNEASFQDKTEATNILDKIATCSRDPIIVQERRPTNVQDKSDNIIANCNNDKFHCTPSGDKKSDIPDDYSVPSVPESITEDTVMDGIVPLQAAKNAPNPIELFKKELISEYSEVLFDPIVPLPSPSKVRPKLRPAPRLAPHRRNSIQGSASESEDESRRALLSSGVAAPAPPRQRHDSHTSHSTLPPAPNREVSRIRNDSISSSISQVATQPPPASSPVKEKHYANKARRQEMGRRSWCRRKDVKRDALTMYDLIFYNPTTNPIVPDEDEVNAKVANAKEEAERSAKALESEEDADDPPPADAAPVPQIKLGPNGEIILDEQSLVIKQSDANRKVSSVVREGSWAGSGGGRYTRATRTADWSAAETVRFYRALAAVGTDFTLMAPLFPGRKRRDLYLKFKKEERMNGAQVDKALRSGMSWDPASLEVDFKQERAEAAKKAEAERTRLLKQREEERARLKQARELRGRYRTSRGSKAMETMMEIGADHQELTADEFIRRSMKPFEENQPPKKPKPRQRNPDPEFILPHPRIVKPKNATPPPPEHFATLTLTGGSWERKQQTKTPSTDFATISRIDPAAHSKQTCLNEVPSNIETGSLVVLRVNDPSSASKTMLQTYIAHESGKLAPVSLPPMFLNSVVGYMKKGTPSTMSTASSPLLTSPGSQDSRSGTPGVIQLNPSPSKRARHSSFSITPL